MASSLFRAVCEIKLAGNVSVRCAALQAYMKSYDDPVMLRNITPVSGRILWARHLARRVEEPMEIFKLHPSVFQGDAGRRVVHMFNRVSQVLLEYEMLYHTAWLKTISVVDEGSSVRLSTAADEVTRPLALRFFSVC